jgi:hypothetical protein
LSGLDILASGGVALVVMLVVAPFAFAIIDRYFAQKQKLLVELAVRILEVIGKTQKENK